MVNWWTQLLASEEFWTEVRKRQVLAGVLGLLAVTSLVEVVLVPGAILRRSASRSPAPPTATARAEAVAADRTPPAEAHPTVQLLGSLMESSETKRRKIEEREATERNEFERRLREAEHSLRDAIGGAQAEWGALVGDVRQRHQVDLARTPFDPKSQSRALNMLILSDPTAAAAWAGIRSLPAKVPPALRIAGAQLDTVERRQADGVAVDADVERLQSALRSVESTRNNIRQGRRDLDHLDVLSRAQRFMSQSQERSTP